MHGLGQTRPLEATSRGGSQDRETDPMAQTVLVTGASGFIGSHLSRALIDTGYRVQAMTRRPDRYPGAGEPVYGDVADPESLRAALAGVDSAYYLVHSLESADFED